MGIDKLKGRGDYLWLAVMFSDRIKICGETITKNATDYATNADDK